MPFCWVLHEAEKEMGWLLTTSTSPQPKGGVCWVSGELGYVFPPERAVMPISWSSKLALSASTIWFLTAELALVDVATISTDTPFTLYVATSPGRHCPDTQVEMTKRSTIPSPPQMPHSSRTLPSQSHSPSGMPVPPQTPHSSTTLPSQSHSPSGMPAPPQMPHSSTTLPSQSHSPSGMPVPPQTPHSSTTLPSQSQSPSGMPVPPQMPHSSTTLPSQSHSPSGMPVPPQMPHSSTTLPSQSHSPSKMYVQEPSSSSASMSKLHAVSSVQPGMGQLSNSKTSRNSPFC